MPAGNRWGYFPSVGASWDVAKESFMTNQQIFRTFKLRASYGKVGNDGIPNNVFTPVATQNLPYIFNGSEYLNIALEQLADKNLKWEVQQGV